MNTFQLRFRRIVQLAVAMAIVCAVFTLIPSVHVYDVHTHELIDTRSAFGWMTAVLELLIPVPALAVYRNPRRVHTLWWLVWVVLLGILWQYTWRTWPAFTYTVVTWPARVALWSRRVEGVLLAASIVVAIISRDKREDPIAKARVVD